MSKTSNPEALQELRLRVADVVQNRERHLDFYHYLQALPYGTIAFEELIGIFSKIVDFAPDVALQLLRYMTEQEQHLWESKNSAY